MGPINYGLQSNNLVQQAGAAYGMGAGIRAKEQQQAALLKQQESAKLMQADLKLLGDNPNASAADYSQMMHKHPQLREHLTKSYEFMSKDEKANNTKFASELYASVHTGNIDVAKDLLAQRKEAAKASGDDKEYATAAAMEKMLDSNPKAAETTMGLVLSGITGDDNFAKIQERLANRRKTDAETETIDATRTAEVRSEEALGTERLAGAGQKNSASRKSDAETNRINSLLTGEMDQKLLDQGKTKAEIAEIKSEAINNLSTADKTDAERGTIEALRPAEVRTEIAKGNEYQAGADSKTADAQQTRTLTPEKVNEYRAKISEHQSKTAERGLLIQGKLDQQLLDQGKTQAEIVKIKVQAKREQIQAEKVVAEIQAELDSNARSADLHKPAMAGAYADVGLTQARTKRENSGRIIDETKAPYEIQETVSATNKNRASTAQTLQMTPAKLQESQAKVGLTKAQTSGEQAKTAETVTLTPVKLAGELAANGLTKAQTNKAVIGARKNRSRYKKGER